MLPQMPRRSRRLSGCSPHECLRSVLLLHLVSNQRLARDYGRIQRTGKFHGQFGNADPGGEVMRPEMLTRMGAVPRRGDL